MKAGKGNRGVRERSGGYAQWENLLSKTRLDVVSLALPGVASDDGEVLASDCEDGPPVVRVWVEAPFRGHRDNDA